MAQLGFQFKGAMFRRRTRSGNLAECDLDRDASISSQISTNNNSKTTSVRGDTGPISIKADQPPKMPSMRRKSSLRINSRRADLPKGILKIPSERVSLAVRYGASTAASRHGSGSTSSSSAPPPEMANSNEEPKEGIDAERKRSISFKDILIREYARALGDNPSCSSGPPISISWEYNPQTKVISVDQYETTRPPRRDHFEMVLPRHVRQTMLRQDWNVTQTQMAAAVRMNMKVKNQRRATVNNIGKATKLEEVIEKAGKRVIRSLRMQRSTTKQVAALSAQVDLAARRRLEASKFQADLDAMSDSNEEECNSSDSKNEPLQDDDDDDTFDD